MNLEKDLTRRDFLKWCGRVFVGTMVLGDISTALASQTEGNLEKQRALTYRVNFNEEDRFTVDERWAVTSGIMATMNYWIERGAAGPAEVAKFPINIVRGKEINSITYHNGSFIVVLANADFERGAHEADHTFDVSVEEMPGIREGMATETQYAVANKKNPATSFKNQGKNFGTDYLDFAQTQENYDRSAAALTKLGELYGDFNVKLRNKYTNWVINEGGGVWGRAVSKKTFIGWLNEINPEIWPDIQGNYPVLACK